MWRVAGMFIGSALAGAGAALAAGATPVVVDRLLRGEDLSALVAEHGGAAAPRIVGTSPQDPVAGTAAAVQSLWTQAARIAGTPAETADVAQAAVEAARAIQAADLLLDARLRQLEAEMTDRAIVARASARLADWRARLDAVRKPLRDAADAVVANPDAGSLRALSRALDAVLAPTEESPVMLAAGLLPNHRPRFVPGEPATGPAIVPSYARGDAGEPSASDRSESADAPFTEEVLRQAQSLGHDAARIFDFVRGQIGTQWYAGAMKSPDDVLRSRAGNHVDQARLLVALLRASGVGARYVRGVVSVPLPDLARQLGVADAKVEQALRVAGIPARPLVSSGTIIGFHVEQVWVAAYVPFGGYRGAAVDRSSPAWVPMMPALKPYRFTTARGATTLAGVAAGAWIDAELAEPRIGSPMARLRAQLESFFNARQPPETLDAQLPAHASEAGVLGLVPGTTAHPVVRVLAEDAVLWPTEQVRLRLQLRDETGASLLDLDFPVDAVAGRRLTLSYVPATVDDHNTVLAFGGLAATPPALVRVRPVVMIDGRPAGSGDGALAIGDPLRIEATFRNAYGDARMSQRLVAGGYAALAISAQADPLDVEAAAQTTAGDAEQAAARLLAGLGMRYLDGWNRADADLAGWVGVTAFRPLPSAVLVLGQYEAQRIGAVVDRLEFSGVALDAGLRPVEPVAQREGLQLEGDFLRWSALQGSALEHQVFEQQWGVPSVSADKALAVAPAALRIRLTRGDSVDVLAHPPSVRAAIQAWLDDGKVVDTVRGPIAVVDWRGAAWRVQDLASGESGWFIAGGLAGGSTAAPPSLWTFRDIVEALANPYAIDPNTEPMAAAVVSIDASARTQRATAGEALSKPLTALVRDAEGRPVLGALVTFEVVRGTARLNGDGGPAASVSRRTNRFGIATVEGRAPEAFNAEGAYNLDPAVGPHPQLLGLSWIGVRVASARGDISAGVPYEVLAKPAAPAEIELAREGAEVVVPGVGGRSMRAIVRDRFDNEISNLDVSFTVTDAAAPHPEIARSRLYREGDCGAEPVLNAVALGCASSNLVVATAPQGARAILVPTTEEGQQVRVTGTLSGLSGTATWTTGDSGQLQGTYVINQFAWLDYRQDGLTGRFAIDAAAPGQAFPLPRRISVLRMSPESTEDERDFAVVEPFVGGTVSASPANGTAGAPVHVGGGVWQYPLVAGPSPGPVGGTVRFQLPGPDAIDRSFPLSGATVVRLSPPVIEPAVVPLSPFRATEIEFSARTAFEPAEGYVAAPSGLTLRSGTQVVTSVQTTYDNGTGRAFFPRGLRLDPEQETTATTVLNEGTPFRLESAPARIRFVQGLIEGLGVARGGALDDGFDAVRLVSGSIPVNLDVVTEVDTAANVVCDGDSELLFLLARQARVTISFFAIDESGDESPIATWTPVADQVFDEGVQRVELPVSRLPFGSYRLRLRAVAVNDGEEQEIVARASHREDRNDALPLAHSYVKGVNLANGGAVLSVQDIDLGGVGPSVSLERTYATQRGDVLGVFGRGWSTNLESRVQRSACGTRTVVGGAGQGQRFALERTEPDGTTVYRPLGGYNGALFERDGAYDFIAKDGTRYHYAEPALGDRRLSYIADPNGNRMTLEYAQRDTARVVVALHDDDGRSLRFDLALRTFKEVAEENTVTTTQWVVTAARAPGDLVLTYDYDEYGNLERANRPAGLREETYAYRDVGWVVLIGSGGRQIPRRLGFRLVEARDALNGAVRTYEHAKYTTIVGVEGQVPLGATRVTSIREPDTGLTRFDYVGQIAAPPVTVVTDARNHTTRYEMNVYGVVEVQTDDAGTTRTTWDLQRWQPQSITDANGRITTYGYDRWGNKTLERIQLGDRTIERQWTYWPPETFAVPGIKNRENTATDGRGIVRTTTWDPRGNKASTTRGGITESWGWSTRGLMDRYTDGFGATRTYGWDPFGFPKLEIRPEGGVTQWVYDERGRKTRETDANNGVTDFEYDARDRLVRVTHPVVANERATERIDYDDRLNTVTRTDPRNAVNVQTFDRMGRLLSERQATGETRTFTYDLNGNRTTETDFRGNVTTLRYDAVNRLERREEPLGRTTVYEHDAVGNRTAETVSGGDQPARRTEYRYLHPLYARTLTRRQLDTDWLETIEAYDDNGNRVSLTDAEGRVTTFEYDDRDRLRFERRPLGQVIEYGYDGADRRTAETRTNTAGSGNQIRAWRFDGDGRLREQVDATGATTRFDYDRKDNRIRQINARGAERTWTYDARDRVISESGPVPGLTITYGLDANGNRIGERQPTVPQANNITRTFDALNRLRRVEDSLELVEAIDYDADGHVLSRTNANGHVTTFRIDALGRVFEEARPLGRTWTRTWTVHGELLTETDPRNFETRHSYDTVGRRTATTLPPREGSSAQEGPQWTYDRVGNVLTQRDARGNETTFVYDALNRRERETIAGVAVAGALAPVVRSWTYDTVGNVLTETDRRGIVTAYTWDRENRRKTTTRDGTLIEHLDYDAVGNVVERTDANGTVTRTEYDPADRPKEQIAGDGTDLAAVTKWTYTPLGDVLTITDPESRVTTQTWDQRRRLIRVENGAGEATAYEHDGLGQITKVTPPKGDSHASTRTYDDADRLQTIADGEGNTWTYGYNETDQRTSITNPRGHTTTFAFDGRGLLTAMTYPGGATWTYRHDADNHRILETSPDAVTRTYTVDALGRRRSAAYSPVIAGEATSTGWSYDENGNVLAVSDRIGEGQFITLTRTWDRRDRIASETDPFSRTLRYTYDPYGNRKSRIDVAADETTTYQYDARHRNISVTSPSHGTTALAWYRDDRLRTITQPGNVVSSTMWDRAGRVETITHTANGTPLVTLSYGYDRNGNRDAETLAHAGQPPVVSTYTHDKADRLVSMTVDGATTTYTLDGAVNRTRESTARGSQPPTLDRTCTFDVRDRLEGCTDSVSGVTETHGWDATGRRTSETVGGLTRTTTWDARDRLLTLTESGGPATTYTYDPEGLRIESRRGAEGERVQYDAGHRHAETNGAGNVTRTYQATAPHRATSRGAWARAGAAAMTLFLGMADAGAIPTPRHYLHDAHGTPVAITTHEGALAQRSTWDVWGNPTQVETLDTGLSANPNRIGFTGYVLDLEGSRTSSGASATANSPISNARYYAKARYYGAGRGSFISVDPWDGDPTSPVSLNKYQYGYANPGVYVDPDGRCAGPLIFLCLGAIGAEFGFFGSVINQQITEGKDLSTVDYKRAGTEAVIGGLSGAAGAGFVAAGVRTSLAVAGGITTDTLLSTGGDAINAPPGEFVAHESLQTNLVASTAGVFAGTAGGLLVDAGRDVVKQGWKYASRVRSGDAPAPGPGGPSQAAQIVEDSKASGTVGTYGPAIQSEVDALRAMAVANRDQGGVRIAANSTTSLGYGADVRVDRAAQNLADATRTALRILEAGKTLNQPAAEAYLRAAARGDRNAAALRGTAVQQIVDELTASNRYLEDVLRNQADLTGATNPATGSALRPDYQMVVPGERAAPIIDITTARAAEDFRKTQKYQPPTPTQRIRINVTYDN